MDRLGVTSAYRGDEIGQRHPERVGDGMHRADLGRDPPGLHFDDRLAVDLARLRETVDGVAPLPPETRDLDAERA